MLEKPKVLVYHRIVKNEFTRVGWKLLERGSAIPIRECFEGIAPTPWIAIDLANALYGETVKSAEDIEIIYDDPEELNEDTGLSPLPESHRPTFIPWLEHRLWIMRTGAYTS